MSGVSLLGNGLRQLWSAYERQLERQPVLTQMTTSAILWGSGDLIAQRIEHREHKQHQLHQQQQQGHKQAAIQGPPPGSSIVGSQDNSSSSGADPGYDLWRAFWTGAFGASLVGPVGHVWYQAIDRWCKVWVPKGGPKFIAAKVLLDTAVMGPFYVAGEASCCSMCCCLKRTVLAVGCGAGSRVRPSGVSIPSEAFRHRQAAQSVERMGLHGV